jgi:hypothetical protein
MIKTFRGLIADEDTVQVRLSTNQGLVGYKIIDFRLMADNPGQSDVNHVVKIWSESPGTPDATVNFNAPTLLGASMLRESVGAEDMPISTNVIFDDRVVNQDIYITHVETGGTRACNYYIELEQMKLDLSEATVATLKDMRGRE